MIESAGVRRRTFYFFVLYLSLGGPDVLEETIALGQAVQGIVALTHGTDEAAQSVDVVLAGDGTASLVDLGNVDLDRAVVLGLDDAVGGAALARDVTAEKNVILAFGYLSCLPSRIPTLPI